MPVPGGFTQHGIGGAKDLPLPPELAIAGAVAALAVSFGVLALAWRRPRYDGRELGRPAPRALSDLTASTGWHVAMRTIGLVLFGFGAFAAVFGQDLLTNPVFGMFYVWWSGRPARRLPAARAGLAGGQPGPHDPRRHRPS